MFCVSTGCSRTTRPARADRAGRAARHGSPDEVELTGLRAARGGAASPLERRAARSRPTSTVAVASRAGAALQGAAPPPLALHGLLTSLDRDRVSLSARGPPAAPGAIASAPASPTSSSGRIVQLASRSIAGKAARARPARRPARSPSSRRRSIRTRWRSRSAIPRRRCCAPTRAALRAACGQAVSVSISTTAWAPRAARRRAWSIDALDRLGLGVGRGGEADRRSRVRSVPPPLRDLLGAHPGEHDRELDPLLGRRVSRPAAAAPRSCRTGAGPTIVTRDPFPNGVSHSIALIVGPLTQPRSVRSGTPPADRRTGCCRPPRRPDGR